MLFMNVCKTFPFFRQQSLLHTLLVAKCKAVVFSAELAEGLLLLSVQTAHTLLSVSRAGPPSSSGCPDVLCGPDSDQPGCGHFAPSSCLAAHRAGDGEVYRIQRSHLLHLHQWHHGYISLALSPYELFVIRSS